MTKPSPKRGRPSKLDARSRSEIGRRLALGEKASALAKEFRVGKTTMTRLFSGRVQKLQELGQSLAQTELEIDRLPISEQVTVRSLADQLKDLGASLLDTAVTNGRTARIMATKAEKAASVLTETSTLDDLRVPAAYIEVSNKATSLGMSLLSNHKEAAVPGKTLEELIVGANDSLAETIRKARLRVITGVPQESPQEELTA